MASAPGVLTSSAPSEAALATCGVALAACVALPLAVLPVVRITSLCAVLVSDPSQIWDTGDRYSSVADLVKDASAKLSDVVIQYATSDAGWDAADRDAFLTYRVAPYQTSLGEVAEMYERVSRALHALSLVYVSLGLASDALALYACFIVSECLIGAEFVWANPEQEFAVRALAQVLRAVQKLVDGIGRVAEAFGDRFLDIMRALSGLTKTALVGGIAAVEGGLLFTPDVGALPYWTGHAGNVQWPESVRQITVRPEAIVNLGKHIEEEVGPMLTQAVNDTRGNSVGFPGFGVVGALFDSRHVELRNSLADNLEAGWDARTQEWLPGLLATAKNWTAAEQANVDSVPKTVG